MYKGWVVGQAPKDQRAKFHGGLWHVFLQAGQVGGPGLAHRAPHAVLVAIAVVPAAVSSTRVAHNAEDHPVVVGPFFMAQKYPPIPGAFVLEGDDSAAHAFHSFVQAQGSRMDVPHELRSGFRFGREEPMVKVIGAVAAAEEFDVQHAGECARVFGFGNGPKPAWAAEQVGTLRRRNQGPNGAVLWMVVFGLRMVKVSPPCAHRPASWSRRILP